MGRLKAAERKQQLIEVATRLFAERGFDAATTASIANAAGVSEPILYRHFTSKQELFVAIVTEVTNTTQQHWRQLVGAVTDPSDTFRIICREWPQHLAQCAQEYAVIHNALVTSKDPQVIEALQKHYAQLEEFFIRLITDGQQRGDFIDVDPQTTAWWIVYSSTGYSLHKLTLGVSADYSVEKAVELSLRAILRNPQRAQLEDGAGLRPGRGLIHADGTSEGAPGGTHRVGFSTALLPPSTPRSSADGTPPGPTPGVGGSDDLPPTN